MATMVHSHSHSHSMSPSDWDLLRALTSSSASASASASTTSSQRPRLRRTALGAANNSHNTKNTRRPQLDPLILETAASSGPHVTRNHFLHEFYPHPEDPSSSFSHWRGGLPAGVAPGASARYQAYSSCDVGPESDAEHEQHHQRQQQRQPRAPAVGEAESSGSAISRYQSRQAPRKIRLQREKEEEEEQERILLSQQQQQQHNVDKGHTATGDSSIAAEQAGLEIRGQTLASGPSALASIEQQQQTSTSTSVPSTSSRAHPKHNGSIPEEGDDLDQAVDEEDLSASLHPSLRYLSPSPVLAKTLPSSTRRRSSLVHPDPIELPKLLKALRPPAKNKHKTSSSSIQVICHGRTRVPTPHGEVFLHLYRNNVDDKEHLAFVFDRELLEQDEADIREGRVEPAAGTLRSKSLDACWREGETDMERIVRGAFVGRLTSTLIHPSQPPPTPSSPSASSPTTAPSSSSRSAEPVLIRVHSECFTGETIGSQRCDCGEQLDEAFRLIATSESGRGVIIYLRQEGRGIGLLEKIKAYNLQDLGHDTVTANLLLGHSADMRTYGIAGEILRDLGVEEVKLLTNNPDKIESVEKEGVKVVERVPMVPRGWNVPVVRNRHRLRQRRPRANTAEGRGSKSRKDRSRRIQQGDSASDEHNRHQQQQQQVSFGDNANAGGGAAKPRDYISAKRRSDAGGSKKKGGSILRNKNLEVLSGGGPASQPGTPHSQVATTDEEEAGSYEFPSVPGSPMSSLSPHASAAEEEEEEEEEEDDYDSEEAEQAENDYLIAMNRTGVGMIGGGTTHSKELEKYLRTKIERMGHMLVAPSTPPSTPIGHYSSPSSSIILNRKHGGNSNKPRRAGHSHLSESVQSLGQLHTDPESVNCGEGCEECHPEQEQDEDEEEAGAASEQQVAGALS